MTEKDYVFKEKIFQDHPPGNTFYDTDLIAVTSLAFADLKNFLSMHQNYVETDAGKIANIACRLLLSAEDEIFRFNDLIRKHLGRVAIRRYGHCEANKNADDVAGQIIGVPVKCVIDALERGCKKSKT